MQDEEESESERDDEIMNWIIEALDATKYQELERALYSYAANAPEVMAAKILYGKDSSEVVKQKQIEIFSLLSINNYSVFKHAANSDTIKALEFLARHISQEQILYSCWHNCNEVVQLFTARQKILLQLGEYNSTEVQKAAKFFFRTYKDNLPILIEDEEKTVDNYIKRVPQIQQDFIAGLESLKQENVINDDSFNYVIEKMGDISVSDH